MAVADNLVEDFRTTLPTLISGYEHGDVFNADETALYYKQLPERTLNVKTTSVSGGKRSKERVTLLLCGSMAGEKLTPLVIGKYKNPRCLRGIDNKSLPCGYNNSKNAWMTRTLFENWLSDVNRRMASQRRSILLFLDNASCHRTMLPLSNVNVVFLPPNCSSVLQPMDQGVIWSFKCIFRKHLLEYVLSVLDNNRPNLKIEVDLLLTMHLVRKAWLTVHPDVIIHSYSKAGFESNIKEIMVSPVAETCDLIDDFPKYVSVDDRLFEEELASLEFEDQEVSCTKFT